MQMSIMVLLCASSCGVCGLFLMVQTKSNEEDRSCWYMATENEYKWVIDLTRLDEITIWFICIALPTDTDSPTLAGVSWWWKYKCSPSSSAHRFSCRQLLKVGYPGDNDNSVGHRVNDRSWFYMLLVDDWVNLDIMSLYFRCLHVLSIRATQRRVASSSWRHVSYHSSISCDFVVCNGTVARSCGANCYDFSSIKLGSTAYCSGFPVLTSQLYENLYLLW